MAKIRVKYQHVQRLVTGPYYRPLLSQEGNFSDKSYKCSHSLLCLVQ